MVAIFAFNTGKAIMEDATVKIAINDLSHIGPEKAILLGKALILDLFQRFKIFFNALIIQRVLWFLQPQGSCDIHSISMYSIISWMFFDIYQRPFWKTR